MEASILNIEYKDLKNELQKYNLDTIYPGRYIHISWSVFRKILIKNKIIK